MKRIVSRREVAAGSVAWLASTVSGCRRGGQPIVDAKGSHSPDLFEGGELLGVVEFAGEARPPLDTPFGAGLDGRLYTDTSRWTPEQPVVSNDTFYIRTRCPDALPPARDWRIRLHGLVTKPVSLSAAELDSRSQPMGVHLMECAGNAPGARFGMLGAAEWSGVRLLDVLKQVENQSAARRIEVSGFDRHPRGSEHSIAGASWIFSPEQIRESGAFLATRMNDAPLPADHGFPVRLIVPGWYGCVASKWVTEVRWVGNDVAASTQMREFAVRTHQKGIPMLAADFAPARIDRSAMPVRVEKWKSRGRLVYRIHGIAWGGSANPPLEIRFAPDGEYEPVASLGKATPSGLAFWSHPFHPRAPADYMIQLRLAGATAPSRRLDRGYYVRYARIDDT